MAITAAGVGSGIDIENIVSQLMTLERRPLVALQQRVSSTQAQISALGSFKSQISTFRDAMQGLGTLDAFRKFATSSSDADVLTATANSDAAAGSFSIDVTRLAQNSRYGSKEFASGATVGGGGGDALTLTVDGEAMSVDLSGAMTLAQLRDAINTSAENPGVTASVLNVGNGNQRLLLTAAESGYDKRVQISYGGAVNAATFDFAVTNRNALGEAMVDLTELDAAFSVDGYDLTASSNSVSDVVDGLTLQFKDIGSAVLQIERDDAAIEASAKKFVDAYNALLDNVDAFASANADSGALARSIKNSLRTGLNVAAGAVGGAFTALSQVGIKTNATSGKLEFDSDDFRDALNTDFSGVAQLFAHDDQGVAFRFDALAERFVESDGLIDLRVDSLNDRKRSLEDSELRMESRLDLKEKSLRRQYAALDSLVGNLQSTSNFLLQNLSF